jgi:hypothetical protein
MKARPILFSSPMVRALLDGSKTQTRRAIKPRKGEELEPDGIYDLHPGDLELARCPYGHAGDLLWVRETWMKAHNLATHTSPRHCLYAADGDCIQKWTPSIHMPRWASRITLEIIDVRVQRLKSISIADAIAEGIERTSATSFRSYFSGGHIAAPGKDTAAIASYFTLWESINGSGSLAADPWVYVIEFKVHQCNVDQLLGKQAA